MMMMTSDQHRPSIKMASLAAGFSVIDNWYAAGTVVCQSFYWIQSVVAQSQNEGTKNERRGGGE
jgi:hypothetical protein